ncbi:MAG: hypothetical protein P8184_15490 [Calditrichia bacterium]
MKKGILLSIVLVMLFSASLVFGQNLKEESKETVPILLKALNYNKTLKDKVRDNCVIAVLYDANSAKSETEKEIISNALKDNDNIKIYDKKLKVLEVPMDASTNLEKKIIINKINAFWMTSGLKSFMNSIRQSAKYNQVITLSTDNDLINNQLVAMGTQKSDSGFKLIVNLNEAHNINVDISANLLSTAVVNR